MAKHVPHGIRLFERMAVNPANISCLPSDKNVATRIATMISNVPRIIADPLLKCFGDKMVDDATFMLPKHLPDIRWDIPCGWIEMTAPRMESPIVPKFFGVYVRCNAVTEMRSENLKQMFISKGAVNAYTCLVFTHIRDEKKKHFIAMDPYATAILTKEDGTVMPDHFTVMLSSETEEVLKGFGDQVDELTQNSARLSSLALLGLSMAVTEAFPCETVTPSKKIQKRLIMAKKAVQMPYTSMLPDDIFQSTPQQAISAYDKSEKRKGIKADADALLATDILGDDTPKTAHAHK